MSDLGVGTLALRSWNLRFGLGPLVLLALSVLGSEAESGALANRGLVVETLLPGRAAEAAGLQVGDVLLGWERAAGRERSKGRLATPYDLDRVEREEAPRGPVRLTGLRRGQPFSVELSAGTWKVETHPRFEAVQAKRLERGLEELRSGEVERGLESLGLLAETLGPRSDLRAVWLIQRIAKEWVARAQWERAQSAFSRAFEAAVAMDEGMAAALILESQAAAYQAGRRMPDAIDAWTGAADLYRRNDKHRLSEAYALRRLAQAHVRAGDVERALRSARRSLEISRQLVPGTLSEGRARGVLGAVHAMAGDLAAAQSSIERALDLEQSSSPGSITTGSYLGNLGSIAFQRGRLAEAEDYARRNLEIARQLDSGGAREAAGLNNLAMVAAALGDLEQAVTLVQKALALKRRIEPDALKMAISLTSLGELQTKQEDFAAAESTFQEALTLKRSVAPDSPSLALSLCGLGELETRRSNSAAAIENFREALDILGRKAPKSLDLARVKARLAELLRTGGKLDEAEPLVLDALNIRERLAPDSASLAESRWQLARLHRARGRPSEAARFFLEAIDSLDAQRGYLGPSDRAGGDLSQRFGELYHEAIDLLAELGRVEEAFEVVERSRAQSFLSLLSARDLVLDRRVPTELESRRRRLRVKYDRAFLRLASVDPNVEDRVAELRAQLTSIRIEQSEVDHEIRRIDSRTAELRSPEVLGFGQVRNSLDPGTMLLSYSVGASRSWIFVVRPGEDLVVRPLAVGAHALAKMVDELREVVAEALPGSTGDRRRRRFDRLATDLYTQLVLPAGALREGAERLLIVADGSLHRLPFAALRQPGGGYLAESASLHFASSATVFAELKSRRSGRATEGRVTVFANPAYGVASRGRAGPGSGSVSPTQLTGSLAEARSVMAVFPQAELWVGTEATEERAKALDRGTRLVHFACHATLDERFPLESALALTPPADPEQAAENGFLQSWEIFEEIRLDADLVVLSACSSAGGRLMGGEGLIGLTRAFHYAGVSSIVASLWPIADRGTAPLVGRFYWYLNRGWTPARALQATQQDAVGGRLDAAAGQDLSSPYYWSAFQLIGDHR